MSRMNFRLELENSIETRRAHRRTFGMQRLDFRWELRFGLEREGHAAADAALVLGKHE